MPGTFTYTITTNNVIVTAGTSGAPATFADFVTADRAGTGTFLKTASARSKTYTLTYAVRPVEFRAIVVKFVIAAKTAEADYLFITGTDAWDVAQTESIDVTAGNGTYTSTKRWRTISNISCSDAADGTGTLWADGTLAVTQDIWGVIWNYGLAQYQLDCYFTCGDGVTATYFRTNNETITWNYTAPRISAAPYLITANATFASGSVVQNLGVDGSTLNFYATDSIFPQLSWVGLLQLYGCRVNIKTGHRLYLAAPSANINIKDTVINFESGTNNVFLPGGFVFTRGAIASTDGGATIEFYGATSFIDSLANISVLQSWLPANSNTADGLILLNTATQQLRQGTTGELILQDMVCAPTLVTIDVATGRIVFRYSSNINISDKNGVAISGASLLINDQYGNNVTLTLIGSQLNETLDNTETGIDVLNGALFAVNDIILIGGEFMLVSGIVGNTLTVTRGYYTQYEASYHVVSGSNMAIYKVATTGVLSDVSGNFEEQYPEYKQYYSTAETLTTYSPHKFTISKAGYETLILDNITVSAPIKWHLELQDALDRIVYPYSIYSTESFGIPTLVLSPLLTPIGIVSSEIFGVPTIVLSPLLTPVGISSEETWGVPDLVFIISPSGIISGEAFGVPNFLCIIFPAGIGTGELFGTPTCILGASGTIPTLVYPLVVEIDNDRSYVELDAEPYLELVQ